VERHKQITERDTGTLHIEQQRVIAWKLTIPHAKFKSMQDFDSGLDLPYQFGRLRRCKIARFHGSVVYKSALTFYNPPR
jgi:hypothetical protein